MVVLDGLHYVAIGNPVSKAVIGTTSSLVSRAIGYGGSTPTAGELKSASGATSKALGVIMPPIWKLAGRHYNFVRVAGLSGLSAVVLGAVGSHRLGSMQDKGEAKAIFETANRFHFYHTIALLAAPVAKYPVVTGSLLAMGTFLFSGVLYYRSFTGDKRFARLAPIGGACLMLAWISLLF